MEPRERRLRQQDERMVKEKDDLFICSICGLKYRDRAWAERCEAFCKGHKGACNLEITKHAVSEGFSF